MRTAIIILLSGWAAIASAGPRLEADEHARRGVALYNLGKYEAAISEFEQAYTLFQSDALLFNLAQANRQLQRCERALYFYRQFLEGNPAPALASQVQTLLPKLEAACHTKLEPPAGPVGASSTDGVTSLSSATAVPTPWGASAPGPTGTKPPIREAGDGQRPEARAPSSIHVAGALAGGIVMAGKAAPTTGMRLTVATPISWLHGIELGGALGLARLWRGDDLHNATLAQIGTTICYRSELGWGNLTLAGELGAAYFSSLGYSDGVVPGISTVAQWAPLARAEVGVEHNVASGFYVRIAGSFAVSPRVGLLLTSVGQMEALVGVGYER